MTKRPPTTETHVVLRTILSAGVLAVLLACVGAAAGATWVVDDDGGADYTTIQAAVDAASAGDTIEVRGGTYVENVDVGKRLTLDGEGADVVAVQAVDATDHVFAVTVDYVNISGFTVMGATSSYKAGIYLYYHAEHCNISWNNVSNSQFGIYLHYSNNNIITNNTANLNNYHGICLASSSNNIITNNTANLNNNYGIYLSSSSGNNTLWNNQMAGNKYNFGVSGEGEELSDNDIHFSNTVDGKPIYYWVDYQNMDVPLDAGYVALVNCYNISVEGLKLKNNGQGILLVNTTNSQITNNSVNNCSVGTYFYHSSYNSLSGNNITNNHLGIYIRASSNINTISGNTIVNNDECGVRLYSSNNSLSGNTIADNGGTGVQVSDGSFNIISENTITENKWGGIIIYGSNNTISGNTITKNRDGANGCGVYLRGAGSFNNTICRNDITENKWGIYLYPLSNNNTICGNNLIKNNNGGIFLWKSSDNSLFGNNITSSYFGIALSLSNTNIILSNNIKSNIYGVYFGYYAHPSSYNVASENNITNNRYGIYFRNSSNNEIFHNNLIDNANYNAYDPGTNQWDSGSEGNHYGDDYTGTDSDGDGIGDTPYPIPGGSSEDRYPLMVPYTPHTGPSDKSLVQVKGQPEVHWFQNGRIYWVTDWDVINDMSGVPGWGSVNALPASEFNPADYPQGPRFITTGAESDGLLIRQVGDYKVYRIENGKKRHITYPDVMDLKGYSFDDVIEVSSAISDMFPIGGPIGIEVDLYFNKKTDSGDISHESQFTTGETVKSITETTVAEDYTVETYVRMIKPDGTGKFAYHENSNFQPTDPLQFSDIKRSLYPGTWSAQTKTWNWDEYTFDGTEMEGVYIWEFWYEDVASGKVLGKDVQGYEFTNTPPSPDDTMPPLVRIISPIGGDTVYDYYVLVSGIASDSSGIETLTVNGQDVFSIPVYGVLAFVSLVNLKEGLNEITILARDDSENHNEIIGKITVDYYPFNVKINYPKDGDVFKIEDSIKLEGEITGGTSPFAYDWIINNEVKNSGYSDSGSIEYTLDGLASGEHKVKLKVTDFKGYLIETNEMNIYITPPKPQIEVEIQSNVEMGKNYDFVVKITNPDQNNAHYYSLGMNQVRHDIPLKTWDSQLVLKESDLKAGLIAPGETKEFRFTFENRWNWLDENGLEDIVGAVADNAAIWGELDPTVDLLLLAKDVEDTYMQLFIPATQPIRKVNIDFEPSQESTNSLINSAELKKSITVEIPYTDVKFSSFVNSIIFLWAGNSAEFGFDILTGGPLLDTDWNIVKKIGKASIGALFTFDSKGAYNIAVDPNNDFETVVEPEPIYFPEINLMINGPEKELVSLYLELSSIYRAFETSYIRYAGASEVDEPYYMVLQLEATNNYSIQLMQKMDEIQRLHNIVCNDVEYVDVNEIIEIQNDISLNGLSKIEINFLTREGYEELIQFRIQRILNVDPNMYTNPNKMNTLLDITTESFAINSEELTEEMIQIKINQLQYAELIATSQEIDELDTLKVLIQNGFNDGNSYEELYVQIQLMIKKSDDLIKRTNNISYLEYYTFATQSYVENINSFEPYNINFLPPITTMDQFNLIDGSTLPIKFTARDNDTGEFIYDDTVNVTITNSTGNVIANFNITNGVLIDSDLEQYAVDFNTIDYTALTIGETYYIQVTFGDANSLQGYAIAYFTLVDRPHAASTASAGAPKYRYRTNEDVYAAGSGFTPSTNVDIYVVPDQDWNDGDQVLQDVTGAVETVPVMNDGDVGPVLVWHSPLVSGSYDIVIDANQNGYYDAATDGLDSGSPGFIVLANPPPTPPTDVPALAPAGVIALIGLLCVAGVSRIRRGFN